MMHLIDELKVIPGVVGACIYGSQDGLRASNLPAIFKPERLHVVGKQLTRLYAAGRMSFEDLTDVTLNYDESIIVVRELEKQTLIFAVCDPTVNHNLLSMSFNLLQEEYRHWQSSAAGEPPADPLPAAAVEPPQPPDNAQMPISAELQELLEPLKTALAKILGPMAEFVFDELIEEWAAAGADSARLDTLLETIDREIGEPEKVAEYHRLIAPTLNRK